MANGYAFPKEIRTQIGKRTHRMEQREEEEEKKALCRNCVTTTTPTIATNKKGSLTMSGQ